MSKSLVGKLLEASKLITQARISKASYVSLKEDYIKELANERGVSFDEMTESDYFKSKEFQEDFRKQVEKDTWDKDLPMVYLNEEGWIVKHYKDGTIEKVKKIDNK